MRKVVSRGQHRAVAGSVVPIFGTRELTPIGGTNPVTGSVFFRQQRSQSHAPLCQGLRGFPEYPFTWRQSGLLDSSKMRRTGHNGHAEGGWFDAAGRIESRRARPGRADEEGGSMSNSQTVTDWLRGIEGGNAESVNHLVERYLKKLVGVAKEIPGNVRRHASSCRGRGGRGARAHSTASVLASPMGGFKAPSIGIGSGPCL